MPANFQVRRHKKYVCTGEPIDCWTRCVRRCPTAAPRPSRRFAMPVSDPRIGPRTVPGPARSGPSAAAAQPLGRRVGTRSGNARIRRRWPPRAADSRPRSVVRTARSPATRRWPMRRRSSPPPSCRSPRISRTGSRTTRTGVAETVRRRSGDRPRRLLDRGLLGRRRRSDLRPRGGRGTRCSRRGGRGRPARPDRARRESAARAQRSGRHDRRGCSATRRPGPTCCTPRG